MISVQDKAKIKAFLLKIRTDNFYQINNFSEFHFNPKYQFSVDNKVYFLDWKGIKAFREISNILLKEPLIWSMNFCLYSEGSNR
jgi:hypothetical protein